MTESGTDLIYRPEDFPGGAVCMDCGHPLTPGERYSQRIVGVTEFADSPAFITEMVCVPCGLREAVQ